MTVSVTTKRQDNCQIIIGRGLLQRAGGIIRKKCGGRRIFVVTDMTVKRLHYSALRESLSKSGLKCELISFPAGERSKNFATYERIISQLLKKGADRRSILMAFGGGVTGDMAGFVAATYMRGIELIQIPTTLVAQIDSSIGGKVAIDHPMGKNMIGSFIAPSLVLTDPDLLSTLSEGDYLNGMFEAIKIALVRNRSLYRFIRDNISSIILRQRRSEEQLITKCVAEKVRVVTADPFDTNMRAVLNFGHTLGHALESAGDYRRITHGEAVGRGMILALRLSGIMEGLPVSREIEAGRIIRNLLGRRRMGMHEPEKLWRFIISDKKAENGQIRFVLLREIGKPVIRDVDKRLFIEALKML